MHVSRSKVGRKYKNNTLEEKMKKVLLGFIDSKFIVVSENI